MPDAPTPKTLSFIGCGRVAQTLGRLWRTHQVFQIRQIVTRSAASARRASAFIGAGEPLASLDALQPAEVFVIATSDDAIVPAAERLAASSCVRPGTIVFHCSGAHPSRVLASLAAKGALVASVHPIRSFASASQAAASFTGTWCGMEGDPGALAVLRPAMSAIGARPVDIRTEDKLTYHAAAVFASNYLTTLLDAALQAYEQAGVPEAMAREMLVPLVQGTLDNVVKEGAAQALTGPIARGDYDTVARQHAALSAWNLELAGLYEQLRIHTERLAGRRK